MRADNTTLLLREINDDDDDDGWSQEAWKYDGKNRKAGCGYLLSESSALSYQFFAVFTSIVPLL